MFIAGVILLLAGRQLFWLFVGGAGFFGGWQAAHLYSADLSQMTALVVAVGAGLTGVLLAIFFQAMSVIIAGFISGAYFAYSIPNIFGYEPLAAYGVVVLIGGVTGGVLAALFLNWALALFSSLIGAALIAQSLPVNFLVRGVIFVILLSIGVATQARGLNKTEKSE